VTTKKVARKLRDNIAVVRGGEAGAANSGLRRQCTDFKNITGVVLEAIVINGSKQRPVVINLLCHTSSMPYRYL